jgi:altronate dehydratase large subunit
MIPVSSFEKARHRSLFLIDTRASMAETFLGYRRDKGRAGVRNNLLVLSINGLVSASARRIAAALPGSKLVATPYGRGQLGEDKDAHFRQLVGLGRNPNVGAVVVIGADRPSVDQVGDAIAEFGKPVARAALDDVHEDAIALTERGTRLGAKLAHEISRLRREPVVAGELFLGIECGHSDATSGLVANPLAGYAADRVIAEKGSAVIGETLEWLGAEHILASRAQHESVGKAITQAVLKREAAAAATGMDLLGNNPGEENIRGGLSTIEEKSLGAVVKGGTTKIQSLLALAEQPAKPGLHVMDAPGFSPESLTGFAAAGAQLMLFTTGPGNSFCNRLAPTIKISGHPEAAKRLAEQIDFDGSAVLQGRELLEQAGERLWKLVLDIASGSATWGEILDENDEVFVRLGQSF